MEAIAAIEDLSPEAAADLLRHASMRTYPRNMVIINEGDDTDSVYFILSGRLKVFLSDEKGREVDIGFLGAGEYFGEMALEPGNRSASVVTIEPCRVAAVRITDFRVFMRDHPDFTFRLLGKLIRRTRAVTRNLKSLALLDVYARLTQLLHELAQADGDTWLIDEPLSQQQIACRIGCSREMVSRIFKDLVAGGYLELSRRNIRIKRHLPRSW